MNQRRRNGRGNRAEVFSIDITAGEERVRAVPITLCFAKPA